jgi:hypothetical protein
MFKFRGRFLHKYSGEDRLTEFKHLQGGGAPIKDGGYIDQPSANPLWAGFR